MDIHSQCHHSNTSKVSLRILARPQPRPHTHASKPSQCTSILSSHSLLGTHSNCNLNPSLVLSSRSLMLSGDFEAPRPSITHIPSAPILRKTAVRESLGKRVSFTTETSKDGLRLAKARVKSKLLMAHHSPL